MAFEKLKQLRKQIGEDAVNLKDITFKHLQHSIHLRNLILDSNMIHYALNPAPKGSFVKTHSSKEQKQVDDVQQAKLATIYQEF